MWARSILIWLLLGATCAVCLTGRDRLAPRQGVTARYEFAPLRDLLLQASFGLQWADFFQGSRDVTLVTMRLGL